MTSYLNWKPNIRNILLDKAESSTLIGCSKHAAAITWGNRILSIGIARQKSHPMMKEFSQHEKKIYLHAEIDAIVKCINRHGVEILSGCSMYVLRISRGGFVGLSKPCPICMKAIEGFNIPQVYWSE